MAEKGKTLLTLDLNRAQSAALLRLINRALRDRVTLPDGTDRRAIVCVKRELLAARDGEVVQHGG